MNLRFFNQLERVIGLLVLSSAVSMATTIAVTNASFETLGPGGLPNACGLGCSYSLAATPGWNGGEGQFRPGTDVGTIVFFNVLSDGPTSAFSSGSSFTQTVGATVQDGVTYTLQVDIGDRNDYPGIGAAALVINGNTYTATGSLIDGGWGLFTVNYVGNATDAGQSITIVLSSGGVQANFDNVRLTDSNVDGGSDVPEPGTTVLLGLGLVGVVVGARRRTQL